MKCFFQLVNVVDGVRSAPVSATRSSFALTLRDSIPEDLRMEYMVLVLVENAEADNWNFSTAPFMSVCRFVNEFAIEGV